jgi:hypothetical protein
MPAPYTDYPGASYLVQMSGMDLGSPFHSTTLRNQSAVLQPPSVVWKETLASYWGCTLPGSRDPCRLQSQGVGTLYPTGLVVLISLGPPQMLQEECRTSENKTQTQV